LTLYMWAICKDNINDAKQRKIPENNLCRYKLA
jgi:hypothetical protein